MTVMPGSNLIGDILVAGQRHITLRRFRYATGNLRIDAFTEAGEPYATVSVNFPEGLLLDVGVIDAGGIPTDPDLFFLKDWMENEAIARALRVSGLIRRADDIPDIQSGHITAQAYRVVRS